MKFADSWIDVIVAVITLVGIAFVWFQVRQVARQERLQVGHLYLQRFWEIDDELLEAPKGTDRHRRARHRYLRLTEDEFDAASRGWLEMRMWEVWHEWLASEHQRIVLESDLSEVDGEGDGFMKIRQCLTGRSGHSWAVCPAQLRADSD